MEELLTKYFTGEITQQEKKTLFQAMDSDASLRDEFYALQNVLSISAAQESDNDAVIGKEMYHQFTSKMWKRKLGRWTLHSCKYAALICLVAVGAYFFTRNQMVDQMAQHYTEVTAPSGQRVKINLPDGTIAWLSPCSTLRYAATFNEEDREVELQGATFFDVAHNARKPFRIVTGNYHVTVLGTRFNVVAYPESERFEIDLVEGSVRIDNVRDPSDQLVLKPHEQAVLRENRLYKRTSQFDNGEYLKNGIVSFRSRPFGDILDDVGLWQGVKFVVDPSVDTLRLVTGKFRQSDSLESILRALQAVSDFRYKIENENQVFIFR